ncbi:MAG TPA: mannose-1-phosphate guanylyltransferase [Ignavibacteriaceae bacterium]|nr:mannose-1-phosphate guanylyltransferase [Ignavibacteriaceae bacterium]
MKVYAVIMAGGIGSRFWPRSKEKTPKQLLKIFGSNTMIQDTVDRLSGIVEKENILIITNKIQKPEILNQLPGISADNIIEEPFGRNTAACIGLASMIIKQKDPDAVSIVLPADHIIKDVHEFHSTLKKAIDYANNTEGLITIGITPSRPETGYGYIQIDEAHVSDNIYKVLTFAEKPNYETALRFVESGDFMWNSGMFIWKVDAILNEMKNYMSDLYDGLLEIEKSLGDVNFEKNLANIYGQLRNISIDYGIMEKSRKVFLTKGTFSWSDVGSWEEVYQLSEKDDEGNAITGYSYTDATKNSYIYSPDKFTAVIGLDKVIVINTKEALLVCKREYSQDVKKIVDHLKINKMTDHL